MKNLVCLCVTLSLSCCGWAEAQSLDSSTFTYQYSGAGVFDGITTIAPWAIAGGIEDDDLSLSGTNLVITPLSGADTEDNNGWIQQDGDATPWDTAGTGVVNQPQWTLELAVDLNDLDAQFNDNIVVWAEGGGNRQIIVIAATNVTTFGGTELDASDNTDGQHVFQLQFDATNTTADPNGTYQLYRDGVLIGADLARESGQGQSRLIIGDCCTSPLGNPVDQYEISSIRFDAVGPVPEPAALALASLGLIGLIGLRRYS